MESPWAPAARVWGTESYRLTYQEALKLLSFCDMDPAVFLHHLDVFHLIIEPGQTDGQNYSRSAKLLTYTSTLALQPPAPDSRFSSPWPAPFEQIFHGSPFTSIPQSPHYPDLRQSTEHKSFRSQSHCPCPHHL